ncbi:hypothetical protein ACVW0P_004340 [Mucilaginibacter sp. UYNi724]
MSESEFHSCKGSEAGGVMKPGAIARGVIEPLAADVRLMYHYHSCNDKT